MRLLIDSSDYTAALDAAAPPRILRTLNAPARATFLLHADNTDFVVPAAGARVVLESPRGALFTGFLDEPPRYEYLGWGERGPAYRFEFSALGDESLLDAHLLAWRAPFTNRTAGDILRELATSLVPGAFDLSQVESCEAVASFGVNPELTFSEHAAELALRTRCSYRAHNGALHFGPVGATVHTLNESSPRFHPAGLTLRSPRGPLNDITVLGRAEPRCHVTDYFLGDGYSIEFPLSHMPFARRSYTILEDEYAGAALDATRWRITGDASALSVSAGKLDCNGAPPAVAFAEQLELGGALVLQHGEVQVSAASDAVLGGLYSGELTDAACLAGFKLSGTTLRPIVNGALAGTAVSTLPSHRYAITTRVFASEPYRRRATFHSSQHPAGQGLGGDDIPSALRLVLEVHDIDPANPATIAAPATVVYEGAMPVAPAFARYVLLRGAALHASLAYTRLLRAPGIQVETQLPNDAGRTRLTGALSEGAECRLGSAPELQFYPQHVPAPNQAIRVRYRSAGRSVARLRDEASIAALSRPGDDGVRSAVRRLLSPAARSTTDCQNAARALLDDAATRPWSGTYRVTSDCLPGGATDIWPGDALCVQAPSRGADVTGTIREVGISFVDPASDLCEYELAFAQDGAAPLAFRFDERGGGEPWDETAVLETLPDLASAEVTAITSTSVTIDAGLAPPAGGGIEVRRSDYGWGAATDRNLVGRFTTRAFAVPRLSRVQTYYVRQFEPDGRYGEHSAALHIDYPL